MTRLLALSIGMFVIAVGLVGIVTPDALSAVGRLALTPAGLYAIGAVRVAIGLVLMLASRQSRAPKTIRVIGAVVFLAGLTTPFIGAERARSIVDWETAQGPTLLRFGGALAIALGGLVVFAFTPRRR